MSVAAALSSSLAFAQVSGSGIISGTVVEASNGEPVRKAVVTLTWQGAPRSWATSRTDTSGQFKFEGLPPGNYDLRATKAEAGTAIYGASSVRELGELLTLADGEIRAGIKLRFLNSATISGRVLDSHGDPATYVAVTLLKLSRDLGERALVRYRVANTNDRGEYRLDDIAPGQYYLHADPNLGFASADHFLPQFLGGVPDSKDSRVLTVHGGENIEGSDFHMISEPDIHIHGRVTGVPEALQDANGIQVTVAPADEYVENLWGLPVAAKAPGYAFSYDMPPRRYRLEASIQFEGKNWSASRIVDPGQASDDVILPLSPPLDLKGKLRIEGAAGPPAASFTIRLTHRGFNCCRTAQVASDGTFTLKEVPAGDWAMNVNPLSTGAFLKAARFGDQDLRFARMDVKPGSEDAISIVISMNSAQIHGEVDSGGGDSKRAGILLAPTGQYSTFTRFYYDAATDDSGKFELKGIAPGKYKIFALEKLAAEEFKTPEAAAQLEPLGQEIELAEGAKLEVHPKLIPIERAREALP
jgi:protocatechuate 3,4-dioxygenase beta subunit